MRNLLAFLAVSVAVAAAVPPVADDGYGAYVLIPAGPYKMGDNFSEGDAREQPVHNVTLDAYYIGRYPVTNAEFERFRDDSGYEDARFWPGIW